MLSFGTLYNFIQVINDMDGVYGILVEVLYHVFKDFGSADFSGW